MHELKYLWNTHSWKNESVYLQIKYQSPRLCKVIPSDDRFTGRRPNSFGCVWHKTTFRLLRTEYFGLLEECIGVTERMCLDFRVLEEIIKKTFSDFGWEWKVWKVESDHNVIIRMDGQRLILSSVYSLI